MNEPTEFSDWYQELQSYIGWTSDDALRVRSLGPAVEPAIPSLVDDFYREIGRHPAARRVITEGEAQVERLKTTLTGWLTELFSGSYGDTYAARHWAVGRRHFEIGLHQAYVHAALSRLRSGISRVCQAGWNGAPEELAVRLESLNKLLDLDLALIEDAYEMEHQEQHRRTDDLEHLAERRRMQTALDDRNEQLRLLDAAISDLQEGIIITDARLDHPGPRILFVNDAMTRICGYSREELLGKSPRVLQGPDTDRAQMQRLRQALAEGQAFDGETINYRKDGTSYPFEFHVAPVKDQQGEITHYVATHRDISQRKQAEAALRDEHDFAEGIIETAQCIILVLDTNGKIVRYNTFLEEISDRKLAETRGKDWFETFLPPRDRSRIRELFFHSLANSNVRGNVNPIVTKDGTEREIAWWDKTLRDGENRLIGLLAVGHDITDLKRAQESTLQSERLAAIGRAMAGLAHESRNALQRGQSNLERLTRRVSDRPEAVELIARIQQAQDDLHQLYEEVREYAAPIRIEPRRRRLDECLLEAWEHLNVMRENRVSRLLEEQHRIDTCCEFDSFAFVQVFRNILENSLAACEDPVEIVVRYQDIHLAGQPGIMIAIRDNGPGLNAEQQQRIFEEFYTTKTHGTGLGMAIAKRLVEAHSGRIEAGSALSGGAEILISIPRKQV